MIQVVGRSERFPQAYPIFEITETVTWGDVKIGDNSHLLPIGYEKVMYMRAGARNRVVAEYSNHRHFEAESNIKFPE